MTKAISVVIPCHNRRDALQLTLDSLCRQTLPADQFEVIVVDQVSIDGCRELVRGYRSPYALHLIEQDAAYGPSVARNAGAGGASAPLLLFLDADMIAEPEALVAHVAGHAGEPRSLLCGRVLPYWPAYASFVERAANPEGGLDRGGAPGQLPFYDAFSNHLSMPRQVFDSVGPFDPGLRAFEDVDFAYRAHRLGIRIINCPQAIAYHNHPRPFEERLAQARGYNRTLPILLARYPELHGQTPGLLDLEPIHWGQDRGLTLYRKLRLRVYASAPVRWAFHKGLLILDRRQVGRRLAKILYWRLLQGYWLLGFREGAQALAAGRIDRR